MNPTEQFERIQEITNDILESTTWEQTVENAYNLIQLAQLMQAAGFTRKQAGFICYVREKKKKAVSNV